MTPGCCYWCDEPIQPGDAVDSVGCASAHLECSFRAVGGSLAHVLRRCSCYVRGSKLGDPPGLTRRQAARVALEQYRQIQHWFGDAAEMAPALYRTPAPDPDAEPLLDEIDD